MMNPYKPPFGADSLFSLCEICGEPAGAENRCDRCAAGVPVSDLWAAFIVILAAACLVGFGLGVRAVNYWLG